MAQAGLTLPNRQVQTSFPALQMVRTSRFIRWLGKVTFVLLVFSIIAMVFAPWRQTAPGKGRIIALDPQERPQDVLSPASGIVSSVMDGIREGSYVEKGQILVELEPYAQDGVAILDQQIITLDDKIRSLNEQKTTVSGQYELEKSRADNQFLALKEDLKTAQQKLAVAIEAVNQLKNVYLAKEQQYKVAKNLAEQGVIAPVDVIDKLADYAEQESKMIQAQEKEIEAQAALSRKEQDNIAKEGEIRNKIADYKAKLSEIDVKLADAEKLKKDLENKKSEFGRLNVPAPRSGYILSWSGLVGSTAISKGKKLCTIVPETTELAVELKIKTNDLPLLKEGDHVRLQFDGWPAVQFVGWPSVAIGTFGGKVSRIFPADDSKGNFRIIVTEEQKFDTENEWPTSRYLRQGVQANGWVLLNRVPLGYEIWRQLNGFPPVVADEEPNMQDDGKGSKVKLPKL